MDMENDLDDLRDQQETLYIKIADATGDDLDVLLDEVWELERKIEKIENPPKPPFTENEFESYYNIERRYDRFRDEYGDAAALYSDYLNYHYRDYLNHHERGLYYSF
jgi:hypothetical protein